MPALSAATRNATAKVFKDLHRPYQPVVLANVYDILTARTLAALPFCQALASTSLAVARAQGTTDDDLTLDTNLEACRGIAAVAREFGKPLTVDAQDGYGDRLEETIGRLIDIGVSGVNLEDSEKGTKQMYPMDEAASRIQRALAVAKYKGVPDFVINARCDVLMKGGELEEVLKRGRAYLAAGATTIFVLPGPKRGVSRDDIAEMVKALDGRVNIAVKAGDPNRLTVKELAEMGISRISVGPTLQFLAMEAFATEAKKLLQEKL